MNIGKRYRVFRVWVQYDSKTNSISLDNLRVVQRENRVKNIPSIQCGDNIITPRGLLVEDWVQLHFEEYY